MTGDDVGPDPFGDEPGEGDLGAAPVGPDGDDDLDEEPGEGIIARAFDGGRDGPTVSELREQYGVGREAGIAGRGVARMATGAGVPPILEIATGATLGALKLSNDGGPLDRDPDADADVGGDTPSVGGEGIGR
jgi:hypothetical protein